MFITLKIKKIKKIKHSVSSHGILIDFQGTVLLVGMFYKDFPYSFLFFLAQMS